MNLKIYQINQERDAKGVKFLSMDMAAALTGSHNVDPSIYDEVFSGEVDCENLEDVFARFNFEYHPLYRGRSLSMSDVVVTEGGAFFCENVGFLEIGFDESKTQKPDDLLKIVYELCGKAPGLTVTVLSLSTISLSHIIMSSG